MRINIFLRALLVTVALIPLKVVAGCDGFKPEWIHNYNGTIGEKYKVRVSFTGSPDQVEGVYFYAKQLKDIHLAGKIVAGKEIILDELNANRKVTGRFEGKFIESDPQGKFDGSKLQCEVIVGFWQKANSSDKLALYLSMESSTSGTLQSRYSEAGADNDELIHRNAQKFRDAVKANKKEVVAKLVTYPIKVALNGKETVIKSQRELIANYAIVFSPKYREAIVNAAPRNMFANASGIMLGNGEVWFGADGKVIALNNF